MAAQENRFRKLQRAARDKSRSIGSKVEESGLKDYLKTKGATISEKASSAFHDSRLKEAAKPVGRAGSDAIGFVRSQSSEIDESLGLSQKASSARDSVRESVVDPAKQALEKSGVKGAVLKAGRAGGNAYGSARSFVKPYFEPEDARDLLENTRKELTYITACIMQISYKEAEGWAGEFGMLLSAKLAGAAGSATLFGLVSTFGTAGTGTAIATLSGAAANSATLAAVGSVVGGGMAAGAMVLSGVGVLVGIGAYKLLSSTAREFDTLPEEDKQIVSTAGMLIAAIQEQLDKDPIELTADDATAFLEQSLIPFYEYLVNHEESVCSRLDMKNSVAYRQHVIRDFKPVVIDSFRGYAEKAPIRIEPLIGGVIYALISRTALDGSPEQELVLEALRRSKNSFADATENELSDYLESLSPEQLKGVANNVKGIYHEMRYVEDYNATNADTYARMFDSTSNKGADIQIFDRTTGEVTQEYQLKSTDNLSYVNRHLREHKDVDVLATDEAACRSENIGSSGFTDTNMEAEVNTVFSDVADNTLTDRASESAQLATLVIGGREALAVLRGKKDLTEAGKKTLSGVVQTAAATGITAFLFS